MRIVRLADLSEEERKRVLEEQQNRVNQNRQKSQELQRQANEKFNDVIRRDGEFHTSSTTNIGTIRKAYRNSSNYNTVNNSLNSYYNQNKTSLWDKIIDRSNFIAKKTGTGVMSGMVGIGQALITDTANNMEKGKKENTNQLINNLINSFSSQSPMDYIMRNLPQYAKKQFETLTDKNKNGIEKATSFVNNAVSEVTDSYNNKLSSLSQVLGKINPNTSEKLLEANEKISEPIDKINEKLGEESKKYGTTANVIADVGQSIGNMAPSILASIATKNPNIGLATMGLSAKGQSTEEALKKGADLDIAVKTGNTKGMIEIGTEMLTGGVNIFGKGALDDLLQKGIVDKVKNNVAKFAVKQGVNVAGETLEETISDILGTTIDKGTVDPNAKYTLKDWKDTAVTTTLTTLVLNSLGMAGNIRNISNEDKANKNVQNLLNEKNQNAQNNQQNFQIQQIVQEQNKTVQNIKGFHGTDANFENYNLDYFGKHDEGDFGKAIYFSTNKRMASKYGKNIKENSINLNNPLVINSEQDYQNMWHKLAQEVDKSKLTNEEVTLINDKYTSQVDKDYLLYNTLTAEEKSNALQKLGYDGIIDNTYNQIAVFDSNNIENNSKIEYNNNESVGGLNEQLQRRGFLEGNAEQTRIYKDSQPQQKEYTRAEYEKWEKSVEPIKEADITTEQRTIKNNIKGQYNKDIVFFDGNNSDNSYSGGVSYDNPNKINIDTKQAETFGLNKMIYHEVLESDILNNTELYKDMIKPSIQKIMNDPSFEKQKSIFWEGQKDNVPSDYLIAKDILCDRFSEIKTGEKLDYNNVLSQETNMTIDYAIENFHKSLYGRNITENINEKVTRHEAIQKYRELAKENIENIATWKDKSNGLRYQLETMERNMFDIIPDKAEAQKIVDTYFEPIHKAEADKQKFINKYNERIKEYDLNKYEAEAVQVLGEYKYNPSFKTEGVDKHNQTILDRVNENIEKGKVDKDKVDEAIETFRNIYDELFEIENETLREYGYQEKPYRKGYFPHFIEDVPATKMDKILDKLGFKVDRRALPTDIAGITEQFVPGKTWNRSALERKGNKTDYNALKGFDTYIQQASDNIFHTENIQKLRGLENEIRYQYSDKGVQERIDEILKNETLLEEEKQDLMDQIFAQVDNPVPNLVTELRRYTNALANKKSEADRSTEQSAGRQFYNTVNAIENRFGANAVGLNIGSAVTNFIPITQAYSQVSTKNMGRAFLDTVKSYVKNDGFVDKSTFLTNRLNQSEKLYKTSLEKISDKTSFLFNAIDEVTSNIVVRGKYWENISKGMSEIEAIKNADRFAANVIADRSKGALPTKFEEKNPLTKMFTQFQLEVNNQYRYMFKDIPRDLKDKGVAQVALAFFKMFVGAWLYNKVSEEVTGRKSAFSPIDLAVSSYGTMMDSDKTTYQKISGVATEIGEQAPFVGGLLGGGRVPVDGAIPDVKNLVKAGTGLATNEMDSKKAKEMIGKELSKPLYYVLPPFGGGQMKKSVEGIQTVKNGGSYGVDDKGEKILKFPVESKSAKNYIKAGVFGKYALEEAKGYSERDYKSLNANETKMYEEANLPYKELLEYLDRGLKKKEDKIQYINSKDMNSQQKWGIYKNDIFSKTKREDGTSELSDIEFIVSNGVKKSDFIVLYNKAQENNIDIPKIDDYKSMKEKGISLKNYIDYNVKVKNETKKKVDNGEIKDKQQLKGKDKIQILLDSNYTSNEKSAIYENYIRTKPKENEADLFKVLKQSNINIDEYLRYEQQDFKGDKEDDGTTKGKPVSKSKQKKVYNYVNNMKITRDQKLILLGSQYKLDSSERTELANLINKLPNQTKDEKLKLYGKMKGFTVYKNGKVSW